MTDVLVCAGRARDGRDRPTGPTCGRTLHRAGLAPIEEQARAAGWRVSPTTPDGARAVMCDRCARPDHAGPSTAAPTIYPAQLPLLDLPGGPDGD
ncbi:hypothetical protein JNW90_00835 [Micromonospora sp. STR1s_5]|nr:hypothetical protein [Micromonospora sp. STR1s_5]